MDVIAVASILAQCDGPRLHYSVAVDEAKHALVIPLGVVQDNAGKFRVQAVNVPGSFESRKPLPLAWRGVRDEELSKKSGIPGCIFVHASGFIGGNATYEGALEMAIAGLDE